MEVKLIAADGCWQIKEFPEEICSHCRDIEMAIAPMIKSTVMNPDDRGYPVIALRRIYRYYGRDSHGMPIYKESIA